MNPVCYLMRTSLTCFFFCTALVSWLLPSQPLLQSLPRVFFWLIEDFMLLHFVCALIPIIMCAIGVVEDPRIYLHVFPFCNDFPFLSSVPVSSPFSLSPCLPSLFPFFSSRTRPACLLTSGSFFFFRKRSICAPCLSKMRSL